MYQGESIQGFEPIEAFAPNQQRFENPEGLQGLFHFSMSLLGWNIERTSPQRELQTLNYKLSVRNFANLLNNSNAWRLREPRTPRTKLSTSPTKLWTACTWKVSPRYVKNSAIKIIIPNSC